MSFLEILYDNAPIWFQNLMVTVSGYQRNSQRYGKIYKVHRLFLNEFDAWSLQKNKIINYMS